MQGGSSPVGACAAPPRGGRARGPMTRVSRVAWLYIAVVAAAAVTVIIPRPGDFPAIIWPFAVAAAVHVVINHGLLWGILRLTATRTRPGGRTRLESSVALLLTSDLGYAVLGLIIAALWPVVHAFAAVLV